MGINFCKTSSRDSGMGRKTKSSQKARLTAHQIFFTYNVKLQLKKKILGNK